MESAESFRRESDSLGERMIPAAAYYGIQTLRAVENYPISGRRMPASMIRAVAVLKRAAARAHLDLGEMEPRLARAILQAAEEVLEGRFDSQFVVDVYQAGAGTSFHMNANEVIANRANELLGGELGSYEPIDPNDDVNMGQSTNDVMPTAMRLAALLTLPALSEVLEGLVRSLHDRAEVFADVIKSGRTHLQDAVPVTLGQEFGAYAQAVRRALRRLHDAEAALCELGIGGSAAGTGLNTSSGYRTKVIQHLREETRFPLRSAENLFEAMQSLAPFGDVSAALRSLSLELIRIANDLRLLASGPRTGFDEIRLPAVQPGSSIMPGKINPSIPEMLDQVCFQVVGHDAAIAFAVQAGQLELNVMMPLVAHCLLESISLMTNAVRVFDERCVRGIEANREVCEAHAMSSLGLGTALNPLFGYRASAEVVKQASRERRPLPEVAVARGLLSAEEAARLFVPAQLTRPGQLRPQGVEFIASEPAPHHHAAQAAESLLPEELQEQAEEDVLPP